MDESEKNGSWLQFYPPLMLTPLDNDCNLDLDQIWRNSSRLSTPALTLTVNHDDRLYFPKVAECATYEVQRPLLVECFFHPDHESQSGFKWTGPDPLATSTVADDLFLYMSAFYLSTDVYWVEFRLARFDLATSETVGEHMFFLPRVETTMGNLCRVRGQMLDIISRATSQATVGGTAPCFRLSLWPRTEPLPYSSHSILSPLAVLPPTLSLDPWVFIHNISGNYT